MDEGRNMALVFPTLVEFRGGAERELFEPQYVFPSPPIVPVPVPIHMPAPLPRPTVPRPLEDLRLVLGLGFSSHRPTPEP